MLLSDGESARYAFKMSRRDSTRSIRGRMPSSLEMATFVPFVAKPDFLTCSTKTPRLEPGLFVRLFLKNLATRWPVTRSGCLLHDLNPFCHGH